MPPSSSATNRFGIILLLLATSLAGCLSGVGDRYANERLARVRGDEAIDESRQARVAGPTQEYVLRPRDVLRVEFFYTPELDEETPIRPDGRISLHLIGDVQAAGRTVEALRAHLAERYSAVVQEPELLVVVSDFSTERVYVAGEVARPGLVDIVPGMTSMQAIIAAGGHQLTAEMRNVVVIRDGGGPEPVTMLVDLRDGLSQLSAWRDVPLRSRDIVYVPASTIADWNRFVDQYIQELLPLQTVFNVNWNFGTLNAN